MSNSRAKGLNHVTRVRAHSSKRKLKQEVHKFGRKSVSSTQTLRKDNIKMKQTGIFGLGGFRNVAGLT